ncbi:hypothetical protein Ctob_009433 [Chrysochromulina tobinii]|uniref:PSI-K n=1 Tax=Chrysochromulina tobinii TaxID=1460289 RepID=A0A0M0JTL1_9EUKA|nr:hypothetical protein Ctob_009433 [Chrysochromulina tobinii]|eukprot:KOO30006.1 hypothetical protein Ctob_009433 [Chrysochromulina sp. CCMP291]
MLRHAVLAAVIAVCSGFNVAIRPAASHALASRAVAPTMLVEHLPAIDAASQLVAAQGLVLPIPAFSPAKAFVMMFFNIITIFGMTIQGKGLSKGISEGMTPQQAHDDMVQSFGLTWVLSGTAFGHVLGAGAILGCSSAGFF